MSFIENTRSSVGAPLTPAQLARAKRKAGKSIQFGEVRMSVDNGKPLDQRQWVVEKPFSPMRAEKVAAALRASNDRTEVLSSLADIAHNGRPAASRGAPRQILQQHLALQIAAGMLADVPEYSEWLLIAACMKGGMPASSSALERKLRAAETDEGAFASLFEAVVESHGDKASLRKMLFAARRNPRLLGAVLRQALGLNQNQALRRREVSAEQLAQDIVACGDNIGLLTALADSLEGLQGNPVQNAHTLKKLRGDAQKLASFLLNMREAAGGMQNQRDALRNNVHDALREMELLDGEAIRAQYETPEADATAAPELLDLESDDASRQEQSGRFINVMRRMLKLYDLKDFNRQLDKTKSTLGAAMRAEAGSEDTERRTDILNNLSSMHLSSSFLMMVEEFEMNMQGIARTGSFPIPHVNGKALINELLDIIESGNGQPAQFEKMLSRLGLAEHASASIVALQGVIGILRAMPDRAYPSMRAFVQLREAAQTVLEAAILREEEAAS